MLMVLFFNGHLPWENSHHFVYTKRSIQVQLVRYYRNEGMKPNVDQCHIYGVTCVNENTMFMCVSLDTNFTCVEYSMYLYINMNIVQYRIICTLRK